MRITAYFSNENVPLTSPGATPKIQIRRLDTQATVLTWTVMTEVGEGVFVYNYPEDPALEYGFVCDGDPNATGQTTLQERYVSGSFSGIREARFDTVLDLLEATSEIDQTTDPWTEKWIRQSDLTTLATFQLYDQDLAAINNSNPIAGKHVRRRLKV